MENNLKKFRSDRNLSLRKLSNELAESGVKLSADLLSKYERGVIKPPFDTWNKLANFYNVSVRSLTNQGDYILDNIDESNEFSKNMEKLLYQNMIQVLLSEVILDEKIKYRDKSLEHLASNLTSSELKYYNEFLKNCLLLIIKSQNDDNALTVVEKLNKYFQNNFSN